MLQLRRITTHKRFIPQIDGLRFIAIASVVFFHIYQALEIHVAIPAPGPMNADLAKRGVEMFFAISGFILGLPFASARLLSTARVDLRQYFLRRLTRLEPPYFISLVVWTVEQWVTARRPIGDMLPHLAASFFYLHNFIFGGFPGAVNGVAWSLEVEVQFYLLVPLLAAIFIVADRRLRRFTLILLMLFSGVFSAPLYRSLHFHYSVAYYGAFFLAGFLICDMYIEGGNGKKTFLWDAVALFGWPIVWLMREGTSHIVLPFVLVALYLAAFRGRICSAILSHRAITNIGGMCYSIYLFHLLVIYFVKHTTQPVHIGQNFWFYYALQSCIILPCILLLCGSFYVLIERPCMDREWPQKLRSFLKAAKAGKAHWPWAAANSK